jgi:DTW domain-containing protein YfiP
VEVLILQHPLEVNEAKGSARLLHMGLPHSRLLVCETLPDAALLMAPWSRPAPRHTVLLYPETPEDVALGLLPAAKLDPAALHDPAQIRLVVLDGTWRKSRKMLYQSPDLQQLPRLGLRDVPPSRYRIRKAHRPDQLSTLEASCQALAQLEGNAERFQPLLDAFDGFVAQQLAYRPD